MSRLFRAELLRIASGRGLTVLLLVACVLNALAIFGTAGRLMEAGQLAPAETSHELLRLGFGALLFATLQGALMVTSEFRHGSIARSVFNAGAAERLMAAKGLAALVAGLAFGTAGVLSAGVGTALALKLNGGEIVLDRESVLILAGVFAVSVLAAPWGAFLGWILRSQTGALGAIMAWTLIAESAVIALSPTIGRYLPGGAEASIYRDFEGGAILAWPWGFLLFGGWMALAAVVAIGVSRRRDLT